MREVTWQQALKEYETVYCPSRNLANRTRIEYGNDLRSFIDGLHENGVQQVGEIAVKHVDGYLARLEEQGIQGSTRKRKAITFRSFLSFLYRFGYLQQDISRRVVLPFAEATVPRILTQNEYQRLLVNVTDPRDLTILTLLLQTGIRLAELTRLNRQDIDLSKTGSGEMRIASIGSRKGRVIPLNSKVTGTLLKYLESRIDHPNSALFLNRRGKPLGNRGVEKIVSKYCLLAGLYGISPHALRHTFGVQHIAKGTCLKTVQRVMGHQDIRTTEGYVPLANQLVQKELEINAL